MYECGRNSYFFKCVGVPFLRILYGKRFCTLTTDSFYTTALEQLKPTVSQHSNVSSTFGFFNELYHIFCCIFNRAVTLFL